MRACILHDQLRVPLLPPACSNVWLTSEQHLDINFNPASLLSMGDALAFVRSAQGAPPHQSAPSGDAILPRRKYQDPSHATC